MSAIAEASAPAVDDRLARRNALVLAVAQALAGGNNAVIVSTSGIVGVVLAPDRTLATLSASMLVVGVWLGTLPMGLLAARYGRRFALQCGTAAGILSGLISCAAVLQGSFAMFCLGAFCGGFYAAGHQSYRFAATDTASDSFRPKAISWVLTGGVAAAFIGANLIIATKDLWPPYLFAATYVAQSVLALLAGLTLTLLKFPKMAPKSKAGPTGRPLLVIARTPRFITAVICGVAAYALMNLMMTSAPLAMVDCGHSIGNAMLGTQWHMLGMFAPSFFTGGLILRFGVERIVLTGLALTFLSAVGGACRHQCLAFLGGGHADRNRLELRVHRGDHDRYPMPSPGGALPGPVVQRLPDLWIHDDQLVRLRRAAGAGGLERGQRRRGPAGPACRRLVDLAQPARAADADGLKRHGLFPKTSQI